MKVKVKQLHAEGQLPVYSKPGDAGADLRAIKTYGIHPGDAILVRTGIAIELPQGYEAQIRPRSGLALKHAVTVLNTPGTVDEGYRGEVGVILINHGVKTFVIERGDKIAQMVIKPVQQAEFEMVEELTDTDRGDGGFGSTGKQ